MEPEYESDGEEEDVSNYDFSNLPLKPDHIQRPCWTCPDKLVYLEAFHDLYNSAYDFLVAISEPVARPEFIHQYKLTPYSLYAAVATNIETEAIIAVLDRLSKNALPEPVKKFIRDCTEKVSITSNRIQLAHGRSLTAIFYVSPTHSALPLVRFCLQQYGKAKLVLKHNRFYVESDHPMVLRELLRDPTIAQARVHEDTTADVDEHGFLTSSKAEEMAENLQILREPDEDSDDDEVATSVAQEQQQQKTTMSVSFQVKAEEVEKVKKQAIELGYPLMEEYDFKNDQINPNVPNMDLKPHTRIRHYQERSLAKMFGNGRARSGLIVLPCGAGKTLTGVTASQTIKKSVVCLATNAVSVLQVGHI